MGGFTSDLFGSKPTVPILPKLNLGTEQATAIGNNASNLPAAEKLVGDTNIFNESQIRQMLQSVIPNYDAITGKASTDIESLLKGEIPTDVQQQVQSNAAAKALGGGYAGSGMHGDLVARDLGLNSLQLINQGLTTAQSWIQNMDRIYSPGMINVQSMFVTPEQQAGFDVEERNSQFQRQWMQNQIDAMPDPGTAGWWNFGWGIVDSVLSAYTGGNFSGMGKVGDQAGKGGMAQT